MLRGRPLHLFCLTSCSQAAYQALRDYLNGLLQLTLADQALTIVFREGRQAYFAALEQGRVTENFNCVLRFMRVQHGKSLLYQLNALSPAS